jgi:hypothetical protein
MSQNNKLIGIIVSICIIILVIFLGIRVFNTKDDTSNKSTTNSSEKQTKTIEAKDIGKDNQGYGTYTGQAQVLTAAFLFPDSTFTYNSNNTFSMKASGLSLSLLGNPALQVQGQYPIVEVEISGTMAAKDDGSVEIKAESIKPAFKAVLAGQTTNIDETESKRLLVALTNLGVIIPTPTKENPTKVDAVIDTKSALDIKSVPTSPVFVAFKGSK